MCYRAELLGVCCPVLWRSWQWLACMYTAPLDCDALPRVWQPPYRRGPSSTPINHLLYDTTTSMNKAVTLIDFRTWCQDCHTSHSLLTELPNARLKGAPPRTITAQRCTKGRHMPTASVVSPTACTKAEVECKVLDPMTPECPLFPSLGCAATVCRQWTQGTVHRTPSQPQVPGGGVGGVHGGHPGPEQRQVCNAIRALM